MRIEQVPVWLEYVSEGEVRESDAALGVVRFGATEASVDAAAMAVSVPLRTLGNGRYCEVWRSGLPVERHERDGIAIATNGEALFGALVVTETRAMDERAREAYHRIVAVVRGEGYPNIVRVWNHFPRILEHESGLERYQAFCAGRADGFERQGFKLNGDLPAASAVGTEGEGLVVLFLTTRRDVRNVENPRQLSAFHYPPRYGPRSPSFARATVVDWGSESQVYVSGTASIVGHESVHLGNVSAQLHETMENLRLVLASATRNRFTSLTDARGAHYRVYVRHDGDCETIRAELGRFIGPDARLMFLRGDVCRGELLLEIELVVRM